MRAYSIEGAAACSKNKIRQLWKARRNKQKESSCERTTHSSHSRTLFFLEASHCDNPAHTALSRLRFGGRYATQLQLYCTPQNCCCTAVLHLRMEGPDTVVGDVVSRSRDVAAELDLLLRGTRGSRSVSRAGERGRAGGQLDGWEGARRRVGASGRRVRSHPLGALFPFHWMAPNKILDAHVAGLLADILVAVRVEEGDACERRPTVPQQAAVGRTTTQSCQVGPRGRRTHTRR